MSIFSGDEPNLIEKKHNTKYSYTNETFIYNTLAS